MKPLIILGAGGHSKVLVDIARITNRIIKGITVGTSCNKLNQDFENCELLGDDNIIYKYSPNDVELVNGIGSIGNSNPRVKLYEHFKDKGYKFATLIHPSAVISNSVKISEGSQIMAGVVIQTVSIIGENCIINSNSSIDHDCVVKDHVHVAPGSVICGDVTIAKGSHIGCGSIILQGIKIGESSLIAAGAVVNKDIPSDSVAKGLPAKIQERA